MKKIIIPPVILLICLLLVVFFYITFPEFNYIPFPFNFFGLIISFFGFAIMGKSRDLFRKYQTTLGFDNATYLISEGVFSRTRNPMYLGMFLLLLGISICLMNLISQLIAFCFIILLNFYFVPKEEKMLLENFGQKYNDYKKLTSKWI